MGLLLAHGIIYVILAWILDIALWKSILLTCVGWAAAMIATAFFVIEYSEQKEWRKRKQGKTQRNREK